jgi:hypothetical protein
MHQGEVEMHTFSLVTKMWNFTDARPAGRPGETGLRDTELYIEPTLPRKVAIHVSARIAFKNSPGGFAEAVRFFHGLRRHCAGNGACRSIGLSDSIVRLFVGSLGIAARSTETHCDGSKPYNDRHSANFETQSDRK